MSLRLKPLESSRRPVLAQPLRLSPSPLGPHASPLRSLSHVPPAWGHCPPDVLVTPPPFTPASAQCPLAESPRLCLSRLSSSPCHGCLRARLRGTWLLVSGGLPGGCLCRFCLVLQPLRSEPVTEVLSTCLSKWMGVLGVWRGHCCWAIRPRAFFPTCGGAWHSTVRWCPVRQVGGLSLLLRPWTMDPHRPPQTHCPSSSLGWGWVGLPIRLDLLPSGLLSQDLCPHLCPQWEAVTHVSFIPQLQWLPRATARVKCSF